MSTHRLARPCIDLAVLPALVAALLTVAGGCRDVDPVQVEPAEAGAPGDGGDAAVLGCLACLEAPAAPGPGCSDRFAACVGFDGCRATVECLQATGCFDHPTTRVAFVSCATPCAIEAGISASDSPGLKLGLDLINCAFASCAPACGPDDVKK